ncbi:MAG: hypothetical protein IJP65_03410 [Bacteroidales bacterium]|nr:hypothetical protein [Bacteroidales bacterium]
MKLSQFAITFRDQGDEYIYDTATGVVIKAPFEINRECIEQSFRPEQLTGLRLRNIIFETDADEAAWVRRLKRDASKTFEETAFLTVELTTRCNFICQFCYQQSWKDRGTISYETEESLIAVLSGTDWSGTKRLSVNYIGGEPLMAVDEFRKLNSRLWKFCQGANLEFECKLNTNGWGLDSVMVDNLRNCNIVIPLGARKDYHGTIRLRARFGDNNPRSRIVENIGMLGKQMHDRDDLSLTLRYNVSNSNWRDFDDWLEEVDSFRLPSFSIDIVNTSDPSTGRYHNTMTDKQFANWYVNHVMPALYSRNIPFPIFPRNALSRCKARRKRSFKLFADGRVGLCNGIPWNRSAPLISTFRNVSEIDVYYQSIKMFDYLDDKSQCARCGKLFLCGGPSPCRTLTCGREIVPTDAFIRQLVRLKTGTDK